MSDKETRISTILFLEKYLLSGVKRIEPRFYVHIAAITAATIFVSGFRIGVRKDDWNERFSPCDRIPHQVRKDIESRRIQPNHTNRHKKRRCDSFCICHTSRKD